MLSGSPTHLLLTSRYMSVGKTNYAHPVEAQVFKDKKITNDQQINKRPAECEFFHVIVGQERVPDIEVREASLEKVIQL